MRKPTLILALALVAFLAGACTSPTGPRYPQPKDEDPPPPPNTGLHVPNR